MQLTQLVSVIQDTHDFTQKFAVQQVNSALTIRNWMVGFYIVEYEQHGEDRAQYGAKLLPFLAKSLKINNVKGLDERSLRDCRAFYQTYPQIWGTLSPKLHEYGDRQNELFWAIVKKLDHAIDNHPELDSFPPEILLSHLSCSHFVELRLADTPFKFMFYELQAINNNLCV
ncbi:MAG TPA: cytoplasmic protein, partial [Saprospirales bacterium]|nr:cytoplasmic protein [Saprospirales bacterium]